jgi:subtilisin family serine protease
MQSRLLFVITAGLAVLPATAQKNFLLEASRWGERQTRAVAEAGGVLAYSHAETGIGVVQSFAPDFEQRARATGAFSMVEEDPAVEWVQPGPMVSMEELGINFAGVETAAVNPLNERFINAQWNLRAVRAPEAWALGYTGRGVRVAIVDTGIHAAHVDLRDRVDRAASRSFVPGFDFDQDEGMFWHGTHVAGIVASTANGIGTVGIAPQATIIGVKVWHGPGGPSGPVIAGILYAGTPLAEGGAGADIINISGGYHFPRAGGNGRIVGAFNKAVNYASQQALVVSAVGNWSGDLDHNRSFIVLPAEAGAGIGVSATGPVGYAVNWPDGATNFSRMASYTNYGTSVIHVAAPGGDWVFQPRTQMCAVPAMPVNTGMLPAPCWLFDLVLSPIGGVAFYGFGAGTSMAAPAAAAVAALIKERNPMISVGALKNALARSADDLGKPGTDPFYGRGFVNALRAVTE